MASKNQEIAKNIIETCKSLGWEITRCSGSILTIKKRIKANSNESFSEADSEYFSIFGLMPTTSPGSIWGTDGGGIGALSAMSSGVFTMNKSGCSIRVLNAIQKLL